MPFDIVDEIISINRQLRDLRMKHARGLADWYSLGPFFCGGWQDPYCTGGPTNPGASRPWWDSDFSPDDMLTGNTNAGYWDFGNFLLFTGTIRWAPEEWWVTPPYPTVSNDTASAGHDYYKRSHDGYDLCAQGRDGLGNGGLGPALQSPTDAGTYLPYHMAGNLQLITASSLQTTDYENPGYWTGATTTWIVLNESAGLGIYHQQTRVGGGIPLDPDGNSHYGVPETSWWSLAGNVIVLDASGA